MINFKKKETLVSFAEKNEIALDVFISVEEMIGDIVAENAYYDIRAAISNELAKRPKGKNIKRAVLRACKELKRYNRNRVNKMLDDYIRDMEVNGGDAGFHLVMRLMNKFDTVNLRELLRRMKYDLNLYGVIQIAASQLYNRLGLEKYEITFDEFCDAALRKQPA